MKLNVRKLAPSDYDDILTGWWKDWGWDTPPEKSILPLNGTGGIIVCDGSVDICAGFLYKTNSKLAWVEWIVSNKQYKERKNRKLALELLIRSLTMMARSLGYEYCYSLIDSDFLNSTFENAGYKVGASYNKEMIKKLWE